jgi:hypothetical protein
VRAEGQEGGRGGGGRVLMGGEDFERLAEDLVRESQLLVRWGPCPIVNSSCDFRHL